MDTRSPEEMAWDVGCDVARAQRAEMTGQLMDEPLPEPEAEADDSRAVWEAHQHNLVGLLQDAAAEAVRLRQVDDSMRDGPLREEEPVGRDRWWCSFDNVLALLQGDIERLEP